MKIFTQLISSLQIYLPLYYYSNNMRTTIVACLIAGASAFGTLICEEEDGDAAALFLIAGYLGTRLMMLC